MREKKEGALIYNIKSGRGKEHGNNRIALFPEQEGNEEKQKADQDIFVSAKKRGDVLRGRKRQGLKQKYENDDANDRVLASRESYSFPEEEMKHEITGQEHDAYPRKSLGGQECARKKRQDVEIRQPQE